MGVPALGTTIAVEGPEEVPARLRAWEGAVDDLVLRAITAKDTVEETLAVVRAAARRH
jgi:hypothetical protein